MEPLFSAELIVDGNYKLFNVSFQHEGYCFAPENGAGNAFIVRRIDDAWHVAGLPPVLANQATAALDRYLLSQH